MRLHTLTKTHTTKKGRRVGRGIAAGQGKTAGRGTKGQKSRTGANSNIPRTFDGGATNFVQRLPKLKGFKSRQVKATTVNMVKLAEHFDDKATITVANLLEKGIINKTALIHGIKVVNSSTPTNKTFVFDLSDSRLKVTKSLQTV